MSDVSPELEEAVARLVVKQPFFASLLFDIMKIVEEDAPLGGRITTAATDGRTLYVCKPWFKKRSLDERIFVLCHEVLHAVLLHPARVKGYEERGVGPDFKPISRGKFNRAMDYVINPILVDEHIGKLPVGGLYHPDFTANDIMDEVYLKLPDEDDDQEWDQHLPADPNAPPLTPDQVASAVAKAAAMASGIGNIPGGLKRLIGDLTEPKITWTEHIRMLLLSTAGKDESSWRNVRRRRLVMAPHVPWPGTTGHTIGVVAMYEDTSGSISPDVLTAFRSEMAGMFSELNPEELYLGSCDTTATDPLLVTDVQEIIDAPSVGGGGTDMGDIMVALARNNLRPDTLVILTDGETPWGVQPDYPVIWVITQSHITAPWGDTVHLEIG